MKVTCPISGIVSSLTTPIRGHAIHPHAMLSSSISVAKLTEWYYEDWFSGDLPLVESHLLGCAYLLHLPIQSMNIAPVTESQLAQWEKFWAANMEKLAKLAAKLEQKNKVFKGLPHLVVSSETIAVLPEWLKDVESELSSSSMPVSEKAKELNRASYKANSEATNNPSKYLAEDQIEQVVRRALTGSLLTANESKALPVILSDWALKVTEFPEHTKMRWQRIIQTIFNPDYINLILMSDISLEQVKALEAHLLINTPAHAVGTSHSSILMKRLNGVIPVLEDFNPAISNRKKTNEDDLISALDGDGKGNGFSKGNNVTSIAGNGVTKTKQPTLGEKLAARLLAMKGAKS